MSLITKDQLANTLQKIVDSLNTLKNIVTENASNINHMNSLDFTIKTGAYTYCGFKMVRPSSDIGHFRTVAIVSGVGNKGECLSADLFIEKNSERNPKIHKNVYSGDNLEVSLYRTDDDMNYTVIIKSSSYSSFNVRLLDTGYTITPLSNLASIPETSEIGTKVDFEEV